MTRTPLALAIIALAIAGCATEHQVAPAPAPVVVNPAPQAVVVPPTAQPGTVVLPQASAPAVVVAAPAAVPLRAGYGRIESIIPLPASAAAGGSVPNANKRLTIRMDDGSLQYVDTAGNVAVSDRVQLTADGRMIHPAP